MNNRSKKRFCLCTGRGLLIAAAATVGLTMVSPAAGQQEACENCGPGPHWIDTCAGGMDVFPVKTVAGLDTIGDCIVDTNLVFFGSVSVARGAGSPHMLPTELVSMNLTNGPNSFIAGAGLGQPPGLPPSPGAILEKGDAVTGDSFFDIFFEIHLGGGLYAYNQVSLRAQANILCVPPNNLYSHISGCFPLFDSDANFVANLITLSHQPFPVPMCGEPDAGNCFEANGTPGCNNLDCCKSVCAIDPVCCDVEWDITCAGEALDLCGNPACPGEGSCFEVNATPGCDDPVCCNTVCLLDPLCCDIEWDQQCVNVAAKLCPPPSELIWFNDQATFEAFSQEQGKVAKGVEDFEESILLREDAAPMDDPLQSGIPNSPGGFPFPNGMTGLPNLIVQSNIDGGDSSIPNPLGTEGLVAAAIGFNGAASDIVVSNFGSTSLDLIFTEEKTAVGFIPLSFFGANAVEVKVYSTTNLFLGEMLSPADSIGSNFIGVWSPTAIGRINIFDRQGGNEGADNIQSWREGVPCPWDLDGSGAVGTADLLVLFAQWGTAGPADFDESGAVGTSDLLILFANWGPCP